MSVPAVLDVGGGEGTASVWNEIPKKASAKATSLWGRLKANKVKGSQESVGRVIIISSSLSHKIRQGGKRGIRFSSALAATEAACSENC
jgi:hypothetical protein